MESVTKTNLVEVNINQLIKEPNHPRQESGNLDSLITSVKKDGILSPVTVIKV
ncbi:ParB N-terminal domain-containing protein, partial [bacterium]|nr:ParB N-terminal domain-containing protein [bacterium]